jgi:hypothetical protein
MATTVPPAPTPLGITNIAQKSVLYRFRGNGDGGLKLSEWQIGYGTSPTTPQAFIKSSGTTTVTGLQPAKVYYFWSRGRNSKGWGAWSTRSSARTIAGARVKIGKVWKEAIPYVRVKGKWVIAEPWVRSGGKWKRTS